jgi:hypothetical protein
VAALDLAGTMDALAAKAVAGGVSKKVYAWPEDGVTPPCVVVGYPEPIDFDVTMGRGSDRAVFPIYFLCGKVMGKASRAVASAAVTGAAGTKNALDGPLTVGANTASVRVTNARIGPAIVGAVEYLAVIFDTEVIT